ncbi:MAG: Gfo/Idh/MocA family oxidoreductase [Chthonomonadaceae bacterium]|nr:Gfo/Idh/MocA family oxidoreductase [Chthonomonadaceae bacterium]
MTRRDFMKTTAVTTATMVAPSLVASTKDSPSLKVGLIGCGGRGSGAAVDAVNASEGVVLWSMGDVFEDHLASSEQNLKNELKGAFQVTKDRRFVGWDAYKGVLASGCDVAILTTPPAFRAMHLAAAIDAGKHVFMEKPVAVDAAAVKSVIDSAAKAKERSLNIVAGTQRRHDVAYKACMDKIHGGAIGEIVAMNCYWNQGGLWMNPRQPEWSDMEWQLRNWLYFTWLSGDHICEQHIHNLDVCNWAMQSHPVKAMGMGGREVRKDPAFGHVFDHFAVEFEYANGVKLVSMCRQIDGCASKVSEHIVGTKGTSNANTTIKGDNVWRWEGDRPNPYVEEHKALHAAIRGGTYINEGERVAHSTMTAILGRMTTYSGLEVTWDEAMASNASLMPEKLEFGPLGVPAVAIPGTTKI